jgi:hypothetical protein
MLSHILGFVLVSSLCVFQYIVGWNLEISCCQFLEISLSCHIFVCMYICIYVRFWILFIRRHTSSQIDNSCALIQWLFHLYLKLRVIVNDEYNKSGLQISSFCTNFVLCVIGSWQDVLSVHSSQFMEQTSRVTSWDFTCPSVKNYCHLIPAVGAESLIVLRINP